jgi:polyisoprenoid-binding protein YceI
MGTAQTLARTKWALDPSHSQIGFKVKHLMVTNVRGTFKDINAEIFTAGDDFSDAEIELSINASSADTGDTNRNSHLTSPDFFDAENFKEINFKGISFEKNSTNEYDLLGNLTIKGVTKRIKLDVEFNGIVKDPYGNRKAGFEITGTISRKDFGLTWNAALEAGGVMVGDEVKINCEVQLIQQIEP